MVATTQEMYDEINITDTYKSRIFQFGSSNSRDRDYFVNLIDNPLNSDGGPDKRELMKIKNTLKKHLAKKSRTITENDIDLQFIKIINGEVVWAENKDVEETQNCIMETFYNHSFNYHNHDSCPVEDYAKQSISLKAIKVIRHTLSFLSRTSYRDQVKDLMKNGSFSERVQFITERLENDFSDIHDFGKKQDIVDIYKCLAFYYAQLYGLINKQHIFTKFDVCVRYPDIAPYIIREPGNNGEKLAEFMLETITELYEHIVFDQDNDYVRDADEDHFYSNQTESKVE
ncbi:hypothetical protein PBI_SCTP2_171 [Salicola phage SCTP-2]|nr:hypothetical protein PBI_SCTP2_171 [Salicola phage SCTP-2]